MNPYNNQTQLLGQHVGHLGPIGGMSLGITACSPRPTVNEAVVKLEKSLNEQFSLIEQIEQRLHSILAATPPTPVQDSYQEKCSEHSLRQQIDSATNYSQSLNQRLSDLLSRIEL